MEMDPYEFKLLLTLSVSKDGGKSSRLVQDEKVLKNFVKFLQKKEETINGFFSKNYETVIILTFELVTDEIICSTLTSNKDALQQLYKSVRSDDLSDKLTTVLDCQGLAGAVGSRSINETNVVTVELSKKDFQKGIQHFDDQLERLTNIDSAENMVAKNDEATICSDTLSGSLPTCGAMCRERTSSAPADVMRVEIETKQTGAAHPDVKKLVSGYETLTYRDAVVRHTQTPELEITTESRIAVQGPPAYGHHVVGEEHRQNSMNLKTVKKRFCVYIPHSVRKKYGEIPISISMVFKPEQPGIQQGTFEQDVKNANIYLIDLDVNLDVSPDVTYTYLIRYKKSKGKKLLDTVRKFDFQELFDDAELNEYWARKLSSDISVHRDTFMYFKQEYNMQYDGAIEGLCNYVKIMGTEVTTETLKPFLFELEYIDLPYKTSEYGTQKSFISLLNDTLQAVSASPSPHSSGLFFLASLSLFPFFNLDTVLFNLSIEMANVMIGGLIQTRSEDLVESRIAPIRKILRTVLKCAFGKEVSWIVCIPYLFPFFTAKEVMDMKWVQDKEDSFTRIQPTLAHLSNQLASNGGAEVLLTFIVKSIRSFSLLRDVEIYLTEKFPGDQTQKIVSVIHQNYIGVLRLQRLVSQSEKEYNETVQCWEFFLSKVGFVSGEVVEAVLGLGQLSLLLHVGSMLMQNNWTDEGSKTEFLSRLDTTSRWKLDSELMKLHNIKSIHSCWETFKQYKSLLDVKAAAKSIVDRMRQMCAYRSWKPSEGDLASLLTLCKDDDVLSPENDDLFLSVLNSVANHDLWCVRQCFIAVLGQLPSIRKGLQKSIFAWYKTELLVIKRNNVSTSEKLKMIYDCLFELLDAPCLQGDEELCLILDRMVQKDVSSFGEEKLCWEIPNVKKLSERTQEKFEQHLKIIVVSSSKIGKSSFANTDRLFVYTSLDLVPIEAVLNLQKPSQYFSVTETDLPKGLKAILEDGKFWLNILSAEGFYADTVKGHTNAKIVRDVLLLVCKSIEKLTIPIHVAKKLVVVFNDCNTTSALHLLKFVTGNADIGKAIEKMNNSVEHVKFICQNFRTFETIFLPMCAPDQLEDTFQFSASLNEIEKKLAGDDGCTLAHVIEEEHFWGPFKEMQDYVELLHELQKCGVFLKLCKTSLAGSDLIESQLDLSVSFKGMSLDQSGEGSGVLNLPALFDGEASNGDLIEDSQSEDSTSAVSVSVVANFLSTRVYEKFQACVESFFNGNDVLISKVCELFEQCKIETEISFIESHFGKPFEEVVRKALINFEDYTNYKSLSENITALLTNFDLHTTEDDSLRTAINSVLRCTKDPGTTLLLLSESVQCIKSLQIDDKTDAILSELTRSKNLISFLEDNQDEDFRNLIDAVEEHSDSLVRDAQVSQLIEVKRFLYPLIRWKKDPKNELAMDFLDLFKKQCKQTSKDIDSKINGCNEHFHALKTLHSSVANRGEMTKGIVMSIMNAGNFVFSFQSGECQVIVSYTKNQQTRKHLFQDLSDLKSRALLIINKDTNVEDENNTNADQIKAALTDFIETYDVVHTIVRTSTDLHRSGHFDYREYNKKVKSRHELRSMSESLVLELEEWQAKLKVARREFYLLNYVFSDQLWTLYDFFKDQQNKSGAMSILRFINPLVKVENMEKGVMPNEVDKLRFVGEQLHKLCKDLPPVQRPLDLANDESTLRETISPGKPFIVHLQSGEVSVIKTVLKLYGAITERYPQPHQVLFCSPHTQWDEISLLLSRCVSKEAGKGLFCLANVELLPNDLQFALVDELRGIIDNADMYDRTKCFLGVICRGSSSHPVLAQFPKLTQRIQPMFGTDVEHCLQTLCPNVTTVSSTAPGLGKSETICEEAHRLQRKIIHFPISGPFDRSEIISRLQSSKIGRYTLLHLDVAEVDDSYQLDMFIFELVVLGMVSSGTSRVVLDTDHVYIEIANSLKQWLRNSLSTCTCFKRMIIEWKNYEDFIISKDVSSPVQVVCRYMDSLENASVDSADIHFDGPQQVKPLSVGRCRELLRKNFTVGDDMSFAVVEVFLNVLADQLRKLSASQFFQTNILQGMVGDKSNVKSTLVEEMVDVFKAFASRSVKSYRESQADVIDLLKSSSLIMTASSMVDRVEGMIRWADSNHLLVIFHSQDFNTVSALYRDCKRVPDQVSNLFNTQIKKPMPDYSKVDQPFLQRELEKIVRTSHTAPADLPNDYALTPDNLLKMVLIFLRVKAGIPVLIMGETGCGKTSLITYLAKTTDCNLEIFNIHAGIREKDILEKVEKINHTAKQHRNQQYWLFMDEINTCDHMGLINEMLCHRKYRGKAVVPNLVFLAACNPYKARGEDKILTTGLEGKVKTDTRSNLVYRVHPLPEAMIDYVWDYGSLDQRDEVAYIARMVRDDFTEQCELLIDLLSASQAFIRSYEKNSWCVSLRDVKRCILLCKWFQTYYLKKKSEADKTPLNKSKEKAIILSLAHCYNSRLATTQARDEYCKEMATILMNSGCQVSPTAFKEIVKKEQDDLLNRMDLPESTAKNTALRENVFVIFVCLLNKIPIFVVGKPGCSKSLSVQLIRSNVRGLDSRDPFFQMLPQLYIVSYQGSESSTSEGIIKVFDKAKRYKENNSEEDVLPVVLLDEIGLAEQSTLNPLKVLHSLLEPEGGKSPDVAVVGISNWALDAAKMNRAIHLSRPEPDETELYDTALSISTYVRETSSVHAFIGLSQQEEKRLSHEELKAVSRAYYEYQRNQRHRNFHGLRDYYSLIKYLCNTNKSSGTVDVDQWRRGLLRNFGGLKFETHTIVNKFLSYINPLEKCDALIPVKDLVQENVNDKSARHLMLITHGDSALGILKNFINLHDREHEIIFGSRFEEDLSEDYNYRMLSRIILCMERGVILVLKDLENIYGSLYDMLNQNYTIVGSRKRKNCRIALGPHSNPMCFVHDDFRCVVLVDMNKVDYSDPPFLNRFEKQLLTFKDVLSPQQSRIIEELEAWVKSVCEIPNLTDTFHTTSAITGFSADLLPSLVLNLWPEADSLEDEDETHTCTLQRCKERLLWLFSPDGMLRASRSKFAVVHEDETYEWQRWYFDLPIHKGLRYYMETALDEASAMEEGLTVVVQTRSNILFDVEEALRDKVTCQVDKLSIFKSEKQLQHRIGHFWSESQKELLVLQCKPSLDSQHMLLAKSFIDKYRAEYKQKSSEMVKHVAIVVHLDRDIVDGWQFNFLSGCQLVTLDSLDEPSTSLPALLGKEMVEILKDENLFDIQQSIVDNMLWAFSCIKYSGTPRSTESVIKTIKGMVDHEMTDLIAERILTWMMEHYGGHCGDDRFPRDCWQVRLACDGYALSNSSTVLDAFTTHLHEKIREPLAMIVFLLENLGAWTSFENYQELWKLIFFDPHLFPIDKLPTHREVEFYQVDGVCLDFSFPFSKVFVEAMDGVKELFLKGYAKLKEDPDNINEDDEVIASVYMNHQHAITDLLLESVPQLQDYFKDHECDDFLDDFCDIVTAEHAIALEAAERMFIARWAINLHQEDLELTPIQQVVRLVTNYWIRSTTVNDITRLISVCNEVAGVEVVDMIAAAKAGMSDAPVSGVEEENNFNQSNNASGNRFDEDIDVDEDATKNDAEIDEMSDDENVQVGDEYDNDIVMIEADKHLQTDVSDEQSADDEEVPATPEELLVDAACKAMLPTAAVISSCGNIKNWQYKVNLVLSVASQVTSCQSTLYLLRVCNDFVMNIQIPFGLEENSVSILANCSQSSDNPLESNAMFEHVMDLAKSLVVQNKVPLLEMQKFICLYLARCFNAYLGYDVCVALELYLQRVCQGQVLDKDLHFFGTIIDTIWAEEVANFPDIHANILDGDDLSEENPNMVKLEDVICKCADGRQSPIATLTCDIIETFFLKRFSQVPKSHLMDGTEITKTAKKCFSIIQETEGLSLQLVVAVAFFKAFLRSVGSVLKDTEQFITNASADSFLQELSSMLHISSEETTANRRKESLKTFFFKTLHKDKSFQQLVLFCNEYLCKIPALQDTNWAESEQMNPIGLRLMSTVPDYQQAVEVYLKLLSGDESLLPGYVTEARASADKRFAILSVMIDNLYLVSAHRDLKETERETGKILLKHLDKFPHFFQNLAKCLTLETKFDIPLLNISPESTVDDVQMASVMVHLLSMTACFGVEFDYSKDASSLLAKASLDPSSLKTLYIPSSYDDVKEKVTKSALQTYECACLHKLAMTSTMCPVCKLDHCSAENQSLSPKEGDKHEEFAQPLPGFRDFITPDYYPRRLTSASYTILRVLLNSSILSGYAVMKHDLSEVRIDNENALSHEDTVKETTAELQTMWKRLESLLALPSHQLCCFMHAVLRRLQQLINNKTCQFKSNNQRSEWEKLFTKELHDIIPQRHRIIKDTMLQTIFDKEKFEAKILELQDDAHAEKRLSLLFRFTPLKSTELLHGAYQLSGLAKKHPFLGLFFGSGKNLSVLKSLKDLLDWQKLITSCKSHHISRKQCNENISEIVGSKENSDKVRTKLREALPSFIKAWSEVKQFKNILAEYDPTLVELPVLHHESHFKDCVVFSKESIIFKVVKALAKMQNDFLDKVLKMAASGDCIALSFLLRGTSTAVIPMTPIQEAATPQIIQCSWKEWKDDLLRLSQFNTTYGMGYDLQFDFSAIEMDLAKSLVFEKAHLLIDEGFPFFSFAHELPANSTIVSQIEKTIPQEPLPESASQQLKQLNEASPNNTTALKFHLDVILKMLQRSRFSAESPLTSIVDCADKWYSATGENFPTDMLPKPSSMLKLCHLSGLYEILEELLCRNSEDKLPDKFRQPMNDAYMTEFKLQLDSSTADLSLVVKSLRIFIYRYFSTSDDQLPDESQSLITLVEKQVSGSSETAEGHVFAQQLSDIIKPYVLVANVYAAIKHVEKVIKEKETCSTVEKINSSSAEKKNQGPKRKKVNIRRT